MLARWLDSWPGLGAVVFGMNAQGFNVELQEFPDGWRANFYPVGIDPLSGRWIRVGVYVVDRSAASSVGGVDQGAARRDRMIDDRLVADLDSFIAERRRCGELDTGTTKTEPPRALMAPANRTGSLRGLPTSTQ